MNSISAALLAVICVSSFTIYQGSCLDMKSMEDGVSVELEDQETTDPSSSTRNARSCFGCGGCGIAAFPASFGCGCGSGGCGIGFGFGGCGSGSGGCGSGSCGGCCCDTNPDRRQRDYYLYQLYFRLANELRLAKCGCGACGLYGSGFGPCGLFGSGFGGFGGGCGSSCGLGGFGGGCGSCFNGFGCGLSPFGFGASPLGGLGCGVNAGICPLSTPF